MKKHRNKIFFLLMALVVAFSFFSFESSAPLSALSKLGSRGQEVRNIQSRLKEWGYYKGSIDGIYGQKTKSAVIKSNAPITLRIVRIKLSPNSEKPYKGFSILL